MTGSLHSTLYNTPFACGPTHTHTHTFKLLVLTLTTTQKNLVHFVRVLTILLLRGSLASLTPLMSNSRTCRLSCGRAMILWLAETLILEDQTKIRFESGPGFGKTPQQTLLYACSLVSYSTVFHFFTILKYNSTLRLHKYLKYKLTLARFHFLVPYAGALSDFLLNRRSAFYISVARGKLSHDSSI